MIELTPRLDEASPEALYMQLYRYLRDEIMAQRLPAGQRLPSIRRLAEHLALSRTPVALAYEQLLAEGYIRSQPRSGLFVAELEAPLFESAAGGIMPHNRHRESSRLTNLASIPSSPTHAYHALRDEQVLYDFGYGSIDLSGFPLTKWRRWMNRCLLPENSRLLLYGDLQGEEELRVEIAAYLHQIRGVLCTAEQIVVGAGTYHSLDLLFQLLKPDVSILAAEEAVNDGVKALLERFRFDIRPLRLEEDGIALKDVHESQAQAVYVTPSHQFPFGMTLSAGKRIQLLNWAKQQNAYIIENDYDGEFRYNGRPIPSLQSMDDNGKVVYLGTFSKALTPSFRLSYLVLPPVLMDRYRRRNHSYDQLASPIFQKTLQWFMSSGDFERHRRRMRSLYQRKHHTLLQAIQQFMADRTDIIGAGSGLHILLRVHNGMNEDELLHTSAQAGVKVYPASRYALKPEPVPALASTVLLGFGGLTEEEIRDGIKLLAETWFRSHR